ncbi:hypothetical protein [Arenimonas sp.]|uniref:hypothetical protein n=1 Tax=Arenimonas sp. TaxID=1872635 RepID=UPI0025D4AB2D|nr:hypothetical protein [Arenimonas sp.]
MTLRLKSLLLAALLVLAPVASADEARIDRLTDLLVQAIPMGSIFETLADEDPNWPMQEKPGAVTKTQLGCLRGQLSASGYRRTKRAEVAEYASKNAGLLDQDIRVLSEGGAFLMGKLMLAGVEQERTGVAVSEAEVMGQATPEQLMSFMSFMTAPDYAPLRRLAGIGNAFDASATAEENEASGEAAGSDMATRVMLAAMSACDVPTSVLFD